MRSASEPSPAVCARAQAITLLVGILPVIGLMLLPVSSARAAVLTHTGTTATGGMGWVDVDLETDWDGALSSNQTFRENAVHFFAYGYDSPSQPPLRMRQTFVNQTSIPWVEFLVLLVGADMYGVNGGAGGFPARQVDPVVEGGTGAHDIGFQAIPSGSVSIDHSLLYRQLDPGQQFMDALVDVVFKDPVDPGESFQLTYFAEDPVGAPFPMFVVGAMPIPTPEPAAVVLLAAGALLWARRHSRRS